MQVPERFKFLDCLSAKKADKNKAVVFAANRCIPKRGCIGFCLAHEAG
jgi:hypothetical protein